MEKTLPTKDMLENNQGLLIVISGPSGAGKGTLCKQLLQEEPSLQCSISATTRQPRHGEIDGKHYFFVTREQFEELKQQGEFLEYAEFCDHLYGTPKHAVEQAINAGRNVILEIEIQGALQIKKKFPTGIFIFIVPPSLDELAARIVKRGSESEESIRQRLNKASHELEYVSEYDYIVVNDKVDAAVQKLKAIVTAEKCKVKRRNFSF